MSPKAPGPSATSEARTLPMTGTVRASAVCAGSIPMTVPATGVSPSTRTDAGSPTRMVLASRGENWATKSPPPARARRTIGRERRGRHRHGDLGDGIHDRRTIALEHPRSHVRERLRVVDPARPEHGCPNVVCVAVAGRDNDAARLERGRDALRRDAVSREAQGIERDEVFPGLACEHADDRDAGEADESGPQPIGGELSQRRGAQGVREMPMPMGQARGSGRPVAR